MLLTTEQAKSLDKATLGEPNSRLNFLMKNAGTHIADETKILVKDIEKPLIFILCGKGNNGGDCFAAASILHQDGYSILLHSIVDEIQIKDDSLDFYLDCKSKNIPISFGCLPKHLGNIDLIIDGLVGIGLKGKLKNDIKPISNWINNTDVKVLSVDIPTGLNADNGNVCNASVKANSTITFGYPKIGMYLKNGPQYCGEIITKDIGFKSLDEVKLPGLKWSIIDNEVPKQFLKIPKIESNKYQAGKVLIIAGAKGMTGASILTTFGALRSGAGLTITTVPESLNGIYEQSIFEGMTLALEDNGTGVLKIEHFDSIMEKVKWADSVVMGPGMGRDNSTQSLIKKLFFSINKPLVLDADGFFPFSRKLEILSERKYPLVITPHIYEFSRLIDIDAENIELEFPKIINFFMKHFNHTILLKQTPVCVAEGSNVRINNTGNPGLATAGTGDILAGIISTLLAQGINCYDAASIGAYIHGKASDDLISNLGFRGQIASDLLKTIPSVIKEYELS